MATSKGKSGGAKKIGRNISSMQNIRYKSEGRRELNKIRRAKKHMKNHPTDKTAYQYSL